MIGKAQTMMRYADTLRRLQGRISRLHEEQRAPLVTAFACAAACDDHVAGYRHLLKVEQAHSAAIGLTDATLTELNYRRPSGWTWQIAVDVIRRYVPSLIAPPTPPSK